MRRFHQSTPMAGLAATAFRITASLALALGVLFGTASCASAPGDVQYAALDDHRLAYRVLGEGEPTIVMIAGLGYGMATFADVAAELATTATVIIYDRPGYGGSDERTGARDAAAAERDLSALLHQSGVRGPYLLVGHSLGGLYAEYFAAAHPDEVLGVVLEESRPADFTRRCEDAGISVCAFPSSLAWTLPEGGRAELTALLATGAQVAATGAAHDTPMLILSRPTPEDPNAFDSLWSMAQRDLAARYLNARHRIAPDGGHYIHADQRAWFVEQVRAFINEMRAQRAADEPAT